MRLLGCAAGVLGGAGWVAAPFLSGDLADYAEYAGLGLMSVTWFVIGLLVASGSLVWLRAIVGAGCVGLAWSLTYAARAELADSLVLAVVGALGILIGVGLLTTSRGGTRTRGTHAR